MEGGTLTRRAGGSAGAGPPVPPRRGYLTGTVRAADGTPLPGVAVRPLSLDDPAQPIPELVVMTDPRGAYRWSLPPGRYALDVDPGVSLTPARVTVTAGATARLDLTLG